MYVPFLYVYVGAGTGVGVGVGVGAGVGGGVGMGVVVFGAGLVAAGAGGALGAVAAGAGGVGVVGGLESLFAGRVVLVVATLPVVEDGASTTFTCAGGVGVSLAASR